MAATSAWALRSLGAGGLDTEDMDTAWINDVC